MRGSPESSGAVTGTKREPSGFHRKEIEKGLSWELQEAKGGRKAVCAPARRSQRGCEQTQMPRPGAAEAPGQRWASHREGSVGPRDQKERPEAQGQAAWPGDEEPPSG